MNVVRTIRGIVFLTMYTSLVLPAYLVFRFHVPEWLFLYGPILAFWTLLIYAQIEGSQSNPGTLMKVEEAPQ